MRSKASLPSARTPVTVDTRCCTATVRSSRHRRGTRTLPGRQTRPRSLRRTSTIITFSARSLALASSSQASARSVARSRPRGRVPLIGSVVTTPSRSTDRNGSGEADSSARGPPGQRARTEVEVCREERRVPGPKPAIAFPRPAVERRLEPAGEVRLVDLARGDTRANDVDAGLIGGPVEARHEAEVLCRVPVPSRGRPRRRDVVARSGAHGPRRDGGPAGARRRQRPAGEPCRPRPAIRHDPVVEREPERRQLLVVDREGRRRSKTWPRSYPRKPTSPPANNGASAGSGVASSRATRRRATANGSDPAAGASRTATGSAVK